MTLSESLGSFFGPRQGKARPYKRNERRAWPIHAYVGPNGSGKSAAMVWDSLPTLEAGRPVLSTVRLLDYSDPRPCEGFRSQDGLELTCELCAAGSGDHRQAHPLWRPFTDWSQLLLARECDVLMDEVTGVASSRESYSMPAPVANKLVQMRRADVVIRWSAPNWSRADKIIRECSQAVTQANGAWPIRSYDENGQRAWRDRRLFKWDTYDASDFEDFTVGKREQLRPVTRDKFWGPGSVVFDAYDTLDAVLTIGTVSDSGRCYHCGGGRKAPECSCPDYHARKAASRAAVAALSGAAAKPEHGDAAAPRGRRVRAVGAATALQ